MNLPRFGQGTRILATALAPRNGPTAGRQPHGSRALGRAPWSRPDHRVMVAGATIYLERAHVEGAPDVALDLGVAALFAESVRKGSLELGPVGLSASPRADAATSATSQARP